MDEVKPPRTLTLEEATALLPTIKARLAQLRGLHRSLEETNQRLEDLQAKAAVGNGYPAQALTRQVDELATHRAQLIEAVESALAQLEDLGCHLKDLETGLVDFYSLRDGELVFLCWRAGEESIQFWHTLEGGFAGRQPLTR